MTETLQAQHDWALYLEVPLTQREVANLAGGGKLSLRNPTAQLDRQVIRCRVCGAHIDHLGTECE
jgi:hypothetical protein